MNNQHTNQKSTSPLFDMVAVKLASPDAINSWSFGEVQKPETINYRTQRSERGGLFCEKIFGPEKDYECYCGKYKGIRYKGIVCEKCGVELTRSIVRRERMGHIQLAAPVAHVWFVRSIPSRIALLLGISNADLEKVVYFAGYIVTKVNDEERARLISDIESEYKSKVKSLKDEKSQEALKQVFTETKQTVEGITQGTILDDVTYNRFALKYSSLFEAQTGAEAVFNIFKSLDLDAFITDLEKKAETAKGDKEKISKRLSLARSMKKAGVRPEWMFINHLPVVPPAMRPMVALDGGRHATSDLNDLYRRVINRNNRLKKLIEIGAPSVILRNEKRILQEAVDALLDNSIRHGNASFSATSQAQRRPLKSLADNINKKQGLFRANLLGKRVDYSGRSVIVVGPDLKLDQCGLPKHMALELFRPFVIAEILKLELAYNIRGANKLIDDAIPEVWAILEQVIKDKHVLLNRAPTLHRLGIQAFRPVLIEGNAIQIHPLVCTAYNADFDGDQMAVHIPLSAEAQLEAKEIMASNKNLLRPGDGQPIISVDKLDIVLGTYWMTKIVDNLDRKDLKSFPTPNSAITAHDFGIVGLRERIFVLGTESKKYSHFEGKPFETTVGRLLFNSVLPTDFKYVNREIKKKDMSVLVNELIEEYGMDQVPAILDKIKAFGFKYVTKSGTTFSINDITIPAEKEKLVEQYRAKSNIVEKQYHDGLLSGDEKYRKNIEVWQGLRMDMEKLVVAALEKNSSVSDMIESGARGSVSQLANMSGLKGLIASSTGKAVEFPILSSNKEGLSPIEYFITTHGSRKGLGDTALNTAKSGYLTRRLFDVSQDVIVTEEDCGTDDHIVLTKENPGGMEIPLSRLVRGRFLSKDIVATDGTVLFKKNHFVRMADAAKIEESGVEKVFARSPMTCETLRGVCIKCYGADLSTNLPVDIGEAVGTVAAQSAGEPSTQLTMRTFHAGGTSQKGGDIVAGLPRVEELFDRRIPKNPAAISSINGMVTEVKDTGKEKVITIAPDAEDRGKVKKKGGTEYKVAASRVVIVKVGDRVTKGQFLTDGSANLVEMFNYSGKEETQRYIINEITKIYELQGAAVSRRHLEVIIRQMLSRFEVTDPGDTGFTIGDVVERAQLFPRNAEAKANGGKPAKFNQLIRGITDVSLSRESFLSSASFQNTTRVLINASLQGRDDKLVGLKENVIIGRLIPAGTGYAGSRKNQLIKNKQEEIQSQFGNFEHNLDSDYS